MLRRLKVKFTAILVSLLGLVLLFALGSIFASSYHTFSTAVERSIDEALANPHSSDGSQLALDDEEDLPQVSILVVEGVWEPGGGEGDFEITSDLSHASVNIGYIIDGVRYVLQKDADEGFGWNGRIAWKRVVDDDGFTIVFAGITAIRDAMRNQLVSSACIFAFTMVLLSLVTWELSEWALSPVEEAWDQQRRFVADASHELKTPLSVIKANLQILGRASSSLDGDDRLWLARTEEEVRRMQGLISELLELARMDAEVGDSSVDRTEPQDVSLLVEKVSLQFDAVAFEQGVTISTSLEPDLHVRGNRTELERLVMTLLDNACKYAEPGSTVCVSLKQVADNTMLAVNNHGLVIDKDALPHLFERFYRADRSRAQGEHGGFGLGLAIAKEIAEACGGTISATSDDAAGTTLMVTLPCA